MLTKKFFCPVNGWDCPYFKEDGSCSMVDDGDDPVMECDDAYTFWCDEDHEDYFVWEDDEGSRYDEQELLEQGYHFVNGEPIKSDGPLGMSRDDFLAWAYEKFTPDEWERLTNLLAE